MAESRLQRWARKKAEAGKQAEQSPPPVVESEPPTPEEQELAITVGRFPLTALGRARTLGRTDGLVKIIAEADNGLILGMGIVGPHASELVAEGTLAIEMGATIEDIVATIHPHPTLSEAVQEAAEVAQGAAVHVHPPRRP